jgi:hypothetical protein
MGLLPGRTLGKIALQNLKKATVFPLCSNGNPEE